MLSLAAITDEFSQDLEHALDVLKGYDVRLAELRGVWGKNISELSESELDAVNRALESREMAAICIGSPVFKCKLPETREEMDRQLERLRRCCAAAHRLGAKIIRVFAFLRDGELTPEIWDQIVEHFHPALQIAEEADVILGMENEHACFIATGSQTGELLRRVNSPRLQCVWDPGNAFFAGERPFPEGYEAVRGHVIHVHLKDAWRDPGSGRAHWRPVGEGEIDFAGQFRALAADGYCGALSMEPHFRPEGGTQEDGSRRSLENTLRLLKTEVS